MIGQGLFDMVKTVFCPQDRDALLNVNGVPYNEAQAKRKLKTQIILKIQFLSMTILADLIIIHFLRCHVVFTYSSSQNQLKNMVTKYTHF